MNSDCENIVMTTIERYQMLSRYDVVIVGLSGGADSVALLSFLNSLKSKLELHIVAAHVNHGIRGDEAMRDENFSRKVCADLGIQCALMHANIPELSKELGESYESAGRIVRYEFFETLARVLADHYTVGDLSRVKIATAHNANDCVETMLFNLCRGAGLSGLLSIPPVRPLGDTGIKIIRPIIDLERSQIEEYLESIGLAYMTDSTNLVADCSRNILRLNVIPELLKVNEGSISNIVRCIDGLREDEAFLSSLAVAAKDESEYKPDTNTNNGEVFYKLSVLRKLDAAILNRTITRIVESFCGEKPEKIHIDLIKKIIDADLDKSDGVRKVQIIGGVFLEVAKLKDDLYLKLYHGKPEAPYEDFNIEIPQDISRFEALTPYYAVKLKISEKDVKKDNIDFKCSLDYGKMNGKFVLRNRREGDRFSPPKRGVTKTLKNLFNEMKIPADIRHALTVFEVDGEIAYIQGVGPSDKYIVTDETTKVMEIDFSGR